jgi:hypothetical protein
LGAKETNMSIPSTTEPNTAEWKPEDDLSCVGCGSHANVIVRADIKTKLPLCATCSRRQAMWHEATEHLEAAVGEVVAEWRAHWSAAGLDEGTLSDLAEMALEGVRDAQPDPANRETTG